MIRKIIQVSAATKYDVVALCNDGTLWYMSDTTSTWAEFPAIPQGESDDPIIRLAASKSELNGPQVKTLRRLIAVHVEAAIEAAGALNVEYAEDARNYSAMTRASLDKFINALTRTDV